MAGHGTDGVSHMIRVREGDDMEKNNRATRNVFGSRLSAVSL